MRAEPGPHDLVVVLEVHAVEVGPQGILRAEGLVVPGQFLPLREPVQGRPVEAVDVDERDDDDAGPVVLTVPPLGVLFLRCD